MSLIFATQLTAIATAVLAVFAILTGIYAIRAFRKQSKETSDQAKMLKVQSDRLEVYRTQVDEQREINDTRGKVLELQAREIRASLEQRERAADEERRSQAVRVTAWFAEDPHGLWGARVCNDSDLPVVDVRTFFNYIAEKWSGGDWEPVTRGGSMEKIRVLPPRTDRFIEIPEQVRNQMSEVSDSVYAVSIEFTDAAGNRWERDPRGALVART
jgi:hypothetical protein